MARCFGSPLSCTPSYSAPNKQASSSRRRMDTAPSDRDGLTAVPSGCLLPRAPGRRAAPRRAMRHPSRQDNLDSVKGSRSGNSTFFPPPKPPKRPKPKRRRRQRATPSLGGRRAQSWVRDSWTLYVLSRVAAAVAVVSAALPLCHGRRRRRRHACTRACPHERAGTHVCERALTH